MSEHTQGRLWLNKAESAIVNSEDGRIACPPDHSQRWAWKENARRLVACWNACEGIDTQTLEQHPAPFSALRAERDELLKALLDVTAHLVAAHSLLASGGKKAAASDTIFTMMLQDYAKSIEVGRAAIAKATGGTE